MTVESLSLPEARRIAFEAQLRGVNSKRNTGAGNALTVISRLGYVQIDTISVVERAHELTIRSRAPDYMPRTVFDLLKEKSIFEYWGRQASFLPIADFRYYQPMKKNFLSRSGWARRQFEEHRAMVDTVMDRIKAEGPLEAKDFAAPPGETSAGWWDWKPAKRVLEALYWKGDLMISERRGFRKVYDLTETVLPPGVETDEPDDNEVADFVVRRALAAHGFAAESEIRDYLQLANRKNISEALARQLSADEIIEVGIERLSEHTFYAIPGILAALAGSEALESGRTAPRVDIFSPFDSMVINRLRLKRLFNFDYKLECYIPASKRRFGYFSLPVAWNNDFCCRLDPKAERKTGVLRVKNLVFEKVFDDYDRMLPVLATELERFARFNGCSTIKIEKTEPGWVKPLLRRSLRESV